MGTARNYRRVNKRKAQRAEIKSKQRAERIKKAKRRARDRERLNTRLEYLKHKGITDIISYNGEKYTPKQLAKKSKIFIDAAIKAYKQQQRVSEARRYARAIGATEEQAHKVKTYSTATTFGAWTNRTYTSRQYLVVSWHDQDGESDIIGSIAECERMSNAQILRHIKQRYAECQTEIEGSGLIHGVPIVSFADTHAAAQHSIKIFNERGYTVGYSFSHGDVVRIPYSLGRNTAEQLTISKEFSVRGMLTLLYVVMHNTTNLLSAQFYDTLEYFAYKELPYIHMQIFK